MKFLGRKLYLKKFLLSMICSLFIAAVVEFGFNAKVLFLDKEERGIHRLDLSTAKKGIEFPEVHDKFMTAKPVSSIQIDFSKLYVDKLRVDYNAISTFSFVIRLHVIDSYGNITVLEKPKTSISTLNKPLQYAIVSIRENVQAIEIVADKKIEGNFIDKVSIQNNPMMNWSRFLFLFSSSAVFISIFMFRKIFAQKVEVGFLVLSGFIGIAYLAALPVHDNAWDEAMHFNRAYIGTFSDQVTYSKGAYEIITYSAPAEFSYNDRLSAISHLNEPDEKIILSKKEASQLTPYGASGSIGYLNQSLGIALAKQLNLSFVSIFLMGKIFNLLMYMILIYFAIKVLVYGKMILATVALLPTPLFLATSYTYDAPVFAALALGLSVIFSEFVTPSKKLSFINAVVFFLSVGFAALAKQGVYLPFVLLGLFLAKEKFKSKRAYFTFKSSVIIVLLGIALLVFLPTILNPKEVADVRGGNTSQSDQIHTIIDHPIAYAKILTDSIVTSFDGFIIGDNALATLFAYGPSPFVHFIIILVVFVIFTDVRSRNQDSLSENHYLSAKQKMLFAVIALMSICLIWTALYIDFTPVGAQQINGVQQRYYLPFLPFIYFLFNTNKIQNKISPVVYTSTIFALCSFFSLYTMYDLILSAYCF